MSSSSRRRRPASRRRPPTPPRSRYCSSFCTISSATISPLNGRLFEMKITEPYSPSARAKASVNPVSVAGSSVGSSTLRNVCPRDAPRLAAASSTSSSMSCRTGCTVRTTNGRPMKVSATKTPSGELATWMPCGSSQRPSQLPVPLALNSAASVMPATAVGRANGRSTRPSMIRRPGNE